MKQFLLTSFLLLKGILMIGQGVAGTTSANGVNIIFQDGFSGTSVVATTFTSTTDWVKTNATGSPAAAAINTSWSYNTSSTHCLRQVLANNTGAYLWSPQFTLPATSSGKAFLRYAVKNTSLPTGGSIILGCAYDVSNDGTFDARIKTTHGGFTGAGTPYAEGTSMFSGTGNLRWVFADISSFQTASAQTIRLAMWIDNVGTGSSFTFDLDWFVVGTTPSNDLCNNPFNLINGLNGGTNGFYNSTASGLRPKSTSPDGINMGGAVTYVGSVDNGTVSIPQSGIPTIDGYEPTSSTNDGPFGSNTATIENSLWFSFTTPTDPTACGQAAGSSLRVDFTLPYLSCAANTAGAATFNQGIQGRVFANNVCDQTANAASTSTSAICISTTKATWNSGVGNGTLSATGLAYNTTYMLMIDGIVGSDCAFKINTETFINNVSQSGIACTLLPIELEYFKGENLNNKNLLYWSTASEINNASFEIEKSTNGFDFNKLATIHSKAYNGQSNQQLNYDYEDAACTAYYRLKQTDFNGQSKYHKTIFIESEESDNNPVVMPNPAREQLIIMFHAKLKQKNSIILYDISGRILLSREFVPDSENNQFILDIEHLNPGLYFLTTNNGFKSYRQKILKE